MVDRPSTRDGRRWRNLRGTHGSSLIEVAVVLPVFFMLLFGFINFALIALDMCNLTYGVRAAAHYMALHSANTYGYTSDANLETAARNIINQYKVPYPASTRNIVFHYCGVLYNSAPAPYQCVKVGTTVTYPIRFPGYTSAGFTWVTWTESIYVASQ